jgi:hypothetical protein
MNVKWPFWQNLFKLLVDRGDGTHAERVEAYPPAKLMTDNDGAYSRVRVDVGQTSFWAGKQFRTFQKLSIAAGSTATIRATVGVNIVLYETSFGTEDSSIEMQLRVGGTANGPWTALPVIRKNTMTTAPVVASQVTLDYDGGHTGGTVIDLIRVTAGNKGASFSGESSERGVGPGTYYYVITNTGNLTATVVFEGWWEERS